MKNTTKSKKNKRKPDPQKIRIEFHAEQAQQVSLAGTFNEWRPDVSPMLAVGGGRWVKELMLSPGRYEYRLVVDGRWICDPAAAEKVPNPFDGDNAVLIVDNQYEEPPSLDPPAHRDA